MATNRQLIRDAVGLLTPCEIRWISDEKGFGIFSKQFIPMATLLWKHSVASVKEFTAEEFQQYFESLRSDQERVRLLKTAYGWGGKMVLPIDDSIFWNHSRNRNCVTGGGENVGHTFALRDILPGEELLDNYLDYEHADWLLQLYAKYGIDRTYVEESGNTPPSKVAVSL